MAKTKVPIARIEGADEWPTIEEKPQDGGDVVAIASKTSKKPAPEKAPGKLEDVQAPVMEETSDREPAPKPSVLGKPVAAKSVWVKGSEKPRTKISATPKIQVSDEAVGSSANEASATTVANAADAHDPISGADGVGAEETTFQSPAAGFEPDASSDNESASESKGFFSWLASVCMSHSYAVLGGICGLVVALLVFFIGFWKTLFICLLVLVGVTVGQCLDGDPKIVNLIKALVIEARGNN